MTGVFRRPFFRVPPRQQSLAGFLSARPAVPEFTGSLDSTGTLTPATVKRAVFTGTLSATETLTPDWSVPGGALWTIADAITEGADVELWFDAQDAATITHSSNNVTLWADKSGNANDLVNSSGSNRPQYNATGLNSLPAIETTGSGQRLTLESDVVAAEWSHDVVTSANDHMAIGGIGSTRSAALPAAPHNSILAAIFPSGSISANSPAVHWRDGVLGTDYGDEGGGTSGAAGAYFGIVRIKGDPHGGASYGRVMDPGGVFFNRSDGARTINAAVGEFIFINGTVGETLRQKIEGYLAWKWGLEAQLPSGHPYESAAPTVDGAPVEFTGSLTGTGTTTPSTRKRAVFTGSLTATTTLTPATRKDALAAPALSATGTLTPAAARKAARTGTLAATEALTPAIAKGVSAATSLSGTGGLTAVAAKGASSAPSLSGTGLLSPSVGVVISRALSLPATGTLTSAHAKAAQGQGSVGATGELGLVFGHNTGFEGELECTGDLSAAVVKVALFTGSLSATSMLAPSYQTSNGFIGSLSSTSGLTPVYTTSRAAALSITSTGSLTAAFAKTAARQGTVSGTGSITFAGMRTALVQGSVTDTGTLVAAVSKNAQRALSIGATAEISVVWDVGAGFTGSLSGVVALVPQFATKRMRALSLAAEAALVPGYSPTRFATLALASTGTLTASKKKRARFSGSLSATGLLTPSFEAGLPYAEFVGSLSALATLTPAFEKRAVRTLTLTGNIALELVVDNSLFLRYEVRQTIEGEPALALVEGQAGERVMVTGRPTRQRVRGIPS